MENARYQRFVIVYHGCDRKLRDEVISENRDLVGSKNRYDWLGEGIYFWEYGHERAMEWAEDKKKRKWLKEPAVLGAVIQLGRCFDLLDRKNTRILKEAFPLFIEGANQMGIKIPQNSSDKDSVRRELDCLVINWTLEKARKTVNYQSVRGLFREGEPLYAGSEIYHKSHIQIAVRDPSCMVGYFIPTWTHEDA